MADYEVVDAPPRMGRAYEAEQWRGDFEAFVQRLATEKPGAWAVAPLGHLSPSSIAAYVKKFKEAGYNAMSRKDPMDADRVKVYVQVPPQETAAV